MKTVAEQTNKQKTKHCRLSKSSPFCYYPPSLLPPTPRGWLSVAGNKISHLVQPPAATRLQRARTNTCTETHRKNNHTTFIGSMKSTIKSCWVKWLVNSISNKTDWEQRQQRLYRFHEKYKIPPVRMGSLDLLRNAAQTVMTCKNPPNICWYLPIVIFTVLGFLGKMTNCFKQNILQHRLWTEAQHHINERMPPMWWSLKVAASFSSAWTGTLIRLKLQTRADEERFLPLAWQWLKR